MERRLGIVGTDTEVGKTLVSAILTRAWKAYYWKPVQSGSEMDSDTETVRALSELPPNHFLPEAYSLRAPVSPHLAARWEGKTIDASALQLPQVPGPLIVEGAGGVLSPLNETVFGADLFLHLGISVLVVARSTLGTINHTCLTLEALRARDIPILGVVMSGPISRDNREAIEQFGRTRVLGELPLLDSLKPESLDRVWTQYFDQEAFLCPQLVP